MNNVSVEVLNVFEHFEYKSDSTQSTNGLYEIELNGNKALILRNGDSWGVISHYLCEPVTKCINFMREDRIDIVKDAIEEYLKNKA